MSNYLGFEPTENESGYYFVSYNNEDAERVGAVISAVLEKYDDLPLWYDFGIAYNDDWSRTINEKIERCNMVLLFFTKGILKKADSYVLKEYEMARNNNKDICFVLLDENNPAESANTQYKYFCEHIAATQSIMAFGMKPGMIADEIKKALTQPKKNPLKGFWSCDPVTKSEKLKDEFSKNKKVLEDFFDEIESMINSDDEDGSRYLCDCIKTVENTEYGMVRAEMHNALKNKGPYGTVCRMIEKLPNNNEDFDKKIRAWFEEIEGDKGRFRYRFTSLLEAEEPVKRYFIDRMTQLKNTIDKKYEGLFYYLEEQWLLSVIFTEIYKSGLLFSKEKTIKDKIIDFLEEIPELDVWRRDRAYTEIYCYNVIDMWLNGNNDDLYSCLYLPEKQ